MKDLTQLGLEARALIAGDLFQVGEVKRCEVFRLEMDALLGEDTGGIKFEENTDFEEGVM